ncbi:Putative ribonuclease H protein At1g65750 [Linum perenne]
MKGCRRFRLKGLRWQRPFEEWFYDSLCSEQGLKFGVVCWFLWRSRNEKIFAGGNENPTTVALKCQRWLVAIHNTQVVESQAEVGKGTKIQRQIAWLAGPSDGVTLNSDGSVLGVGGKAAAGGLIRDGYGQCIQAYAMNLGTCTITRVELRGALEGIERAWLAGFDDVRFTAFISPHLNDIPLV